MNNESSYVLVFGASVVDIFGFCNTEYRPFNSTPGRVKMSLGGVCRNIAENLARVEVNTKFISVIGDDEKGRSILEHSEMIGYDMSDTLILKNSGTPTYLAILNEQGEMVSGIADMKSIDQMDEEFIVSKDEIFKNAKYTFLDADSPQRLEFVLNRYKGYTDFILDPVSAEKALSIKHLLKYFHTIKPNRYEAEVLTNMKINTDEDLIKASEVFLSQGIKNVFISLDCEGIFYSNGIERYKITANDVDVCNVTGAGDSFVAGLGYGYVNGLDIVDTIKTAISMSNIAIMSDETINPNLSKELIDNMRQKTDWIIREL